MPRIDSKSGVPTWLARIERQREDAVAGRVAAGAKAGGVAQKAQDGLDPAARAVGDPALAVALQQALVPEKVLAEHGKAFAAAGPDAAALAALALAQKPHQQRQLENALKRFYTVLGTSLSAVAEKDRPQAAQRSVQALRSLVQSVSGSEHLVPACFAAVGLLDADMRLVQQKRMQQDGDALGASAEKAVATVIDLRAKVGGREGAASALNILSNLVEQLEFSASKLTPATRAQVWADVAKFLVEVGPVDGFDQSSVAKYAGAVSAAVVKTKDDPKAALAAAKKAVLNDQPVTLAPARAMLDDVAANTPAGPAKAALAKAGKSLAKLLDATPVKSVELVASVEALAGALVARVNGGQPHGAELADAVARIVDAHGGQPTRRPLLDVLTRLVTTHRGSAEGLAAFQEAGAAADGKQVACELLKLGLDVLGYSPAHAPDFDGLLGRVAGLDETAALRVALSLPETAFAYTHTLAGVVDATIAFLGDAANQDRPSAALQGFAARKSMLSQQLVGNHYVADQEPGLSTEIAKLTTGSALQLEQVQNLTNALYYVKAYAPQVPLSTILADDAAGRPGVLTLTDPSVRYFNPPQNYLTGLLGNLRNGNGGTVENVRIAIELASTVGKIGGQPQLQYNRIQQDFAQAVQDPANLHGAPKAQNAVAARIAQQAPSLMIFAQQHPELPTELAATAGIYLSSDQVGWLTEKMGTERSHKAKRAMRDFVFALVDNGQMALLEALRASPSPPKAQQAVVDQVVATWKNGENHLIQWDRLAQGLKDGKDPTAELAAEAAAAGGAAPGAAGALDIDQLTNGKATAEGKAQLAKVATVVDFLLGIYVQGGRTMDADVEMGTLREPFMEVLKNVATENWPAPKYESPVGAKQLSIFSDAQKQQWRETLVTPMNGAAEAPPPNEQIADALITLKGLAKAMKKVATLGGGELGKLDWNAASLAKLTTLRDEKVATLRQHPKGTPEHGAASKSLAPIVEQLSLLQLHEALAKHLPDADKDPRAALKALSPFVDAAGRSLAKKGGGGFKEAVFEVTEAARSLVGQKVARTGVYAADEDTLDALINSNISGCVGINYGSAGRQWALAGVAGDANQKVIRVYNGDKQVYRGFLRFFEITRADGTKTPALWCDQPMPDGGGGAGERALWFKHALAKAQQLGVPVMAGASYYGGNDVQTAATAAGMQSTQEQVTLHLNEGTTGYMHSDSMFGGKGNLKQLAAANTLDKAMSVTIVTP